MQNKQRLENLQTILVRILDKRVRVDGPNGHRFRSKRELLVEALLTKAKDGDSGARKWIFDYCRRNRHRLEARNDLAYSKEAMEAYDKYLKKEK